MSFLFSYKDIDIYSNDLECFRDGNWLNDSSISFCYKQLEDRVSPYILLMDPSVGSFLRIQCNDPEDFDELRCGTNLSSKEWIFLPITNNQSFDTKSTHWSLLIIKVSNGRIWHLDSMNHMNYDSARSFASKIRRLLNVR
jgi:Ulp1 family protease